ncbi:hypothetical protein RRF57_011127 [Xylaria bambusicola]|uniref:Uncharacterized protein n=1 Tax=Xylaria bambusicola TaxID=326684 RepID=A0AAN7UMA0_9PEZI
MELSRDRFVILRKRCLTVGMHPKDGTQRVALSFVNIVESNLCFSAPVSNEGQSRRRSQLTQIHLSPREQRLGIQGYQEEVERAGSLGHLGVRGHHCAETGCGGKLLEDNAEVGLVRCRSCVF